MGTNTATLYPTWPPAGKMAFRSQAEALLAQRLASVPKDRNNRWYIGELGSNTGSGVDAGDPYLPVDGDAMWAFIASKFPCTDTVFYIKGGTTYRCASAPPNITSPVTISSYYSADDPQAHITTFQNETYYGVGAWTAAGSGAYYKAYSSATIDAMTWVRPTSASNADLIAGDEIPYTICTSVAQCQLIARSFFLDTVADRLYVHNAAGTDPAGAIEVSQGDFNGAILYQVDGGRIHDILFTGFGITDNASGVAGITCDCGGTQEQVISECSIFYCGSVHSLIQLSSGSAGGITTWYANKTGFYYYVTAGYNITSYNVSGLQETLRWDNVAVYGPVPDFISNLQTGATWDLATLTLTKTGAFTTAKIPSAAIQRIYITGGTGWTAGLYEIAGRVSDNAITLVAAVGQPAANVNTTFDGVLQPKSRGGPDYAHTGGAPIVTFNMCWGSICYNNTSGYNCAVPVALGGPYTSYTGNHLNLASYRSWVVDEDFRGGTSSAAVGTIGSSNTIHLNRKIKLNVPKTITNATALLWPSGYNGGDVLINCAFSWDYTDTYLADFNNLPMLQAGISGTSPGTYINCAFYRLGKAGIGAQWDNSGTAWSGVYRRFFNCIFSISASAGAYAANIAPNVAAGTQQSDTPTGGMTKNAFYTTAYWLQADFAPTPPGGGFWGTNNAACGNIILSSLPSIDDTIPVVGDQLYRAGSTSAELPITVEHDMAWNPRSSTLAHSIGPLEGAVPSDDSPTLRFFLI